MGENGYKMKKYCIIVSAVIALGILLIIVLNVLFSNDQPPLPVRTVTTKLQRCQSTRTEYDESVERYAEITPDELYIGDSIHLLIKAENPSDVPVKCGGHVLHYTLSIIDSEDLAYVEQKVNEYHNDVERYYDDIIHGVLIPVTIPERMEGIGVPQTIGAHSFWIQDEDQYQIPGLQELKLPFWSKMNQSPDPQGKTVYLLIFNREDEELGFVPIRLRPRSAIKTRLLYLGRKKR